MGSKREALNPEEKKGGTRNKSHSNKFRNIPGKYEKKRERRVEW